MYGHYFTSHWSVLNCVAGYSAMSHKKTHAFCQCAIQYCDDSFVNGRFGRMCEITEFSVCSQMKSPSHTYKGYQTTHTYISTYLYSQIFALLVISQPTQIEQLHSIHVVCSSDRRLRIGEMAVTLVSMSMPLCIF